MIKGKKVIMQVDSGATCNIMYVMPKKCVPPNAEIIPCQKKRSLYGGKATTLETRYNEILWTEKFSLLDILLYM